MLEMGIFTAFIESAYGFAHLQVTDSRLVDERVRQVFQSI